MFELFFLAIFKQRAGSIRSVYYKILDFLESALENHRYKMNNTEFTHSILNLVEYGSYF